MWKIGCGVTLLGFVLSLASCGLFGTAIGRLQEQRSIAVTELERGADAWFGVFTVEEGASVRVEFTAETEITEDDLARADSSAAILQSSLPANYRVEGPDGTELTRGAGSLSGSTVLSAADHPSRDDTPDRITTSRATDPFVTTAGGDHVALLEIAAHDEQERPLAAARMTVFDRVPTGLGGLTAGGFASFLLGPLVAFVGIVLFAIGMLLRAKRKGG